jgi:hypothetical protein
MPVKHAVARRTRSHWEPDFLFRSALFEPLQPLAHRIGTGASGWPELADYQTWLDQSVGPLRSQGGAPIRFVEQAPKPTRVDDGYEPRIYLKGEVQTRTENWHDFFQVLVWCSFPRTKLAVNARHYEAIARRTATRPVHSQRTPIENALTQFDECGAVVLASDPSLLELVRDFRWKDLFWGRRDSVKRHMRCLIFGHALYEKALTPYPGMTAHCVLLTVENALFARPWPIQLAYVDRKLHESFQSPPSIQTPQDLAPFPLLGYPGWVPENQQEAYYDNTDYFRPGRRRAALARTSHRTDRKN